MIHCVCNNINTAKVDKAALCGAKTAEDVQRHCGTTFCCGQCRDSIKDRLELMARQPITAIAAE